MELDEFTFPTTNPNTPIDSPPLWRLSPTASPTPAHEDTKARKELKFGTKIVDQNGNLTYSRKSCSFLEGRCLMKRSKMGGNINTHTQDDQDQEKMDMLWEDLNYEDLFKNNNKHDPRIIEFHKNYPRGNNEVMEYGCVPTPFKLVRTKKPSMFVLVKVLKRIFVIQQSSKKRSR